MGKIVKRIAIGFTVFLVVFVTVVSLQSNDFRVTRSATINVAPQSVFEHVNDFSKWNNWSPWAKLDPNAKITFEGPPSGTGASFAWDGNNEVGAGKMTIVESRPGELVRYNLSFTRPFQDTSTAEFTFKPAEDKTIVTWNMSGQKNFICKSLGLLQIMNMEKMIGSDFEKGLASIKSVAEGTAAGTSEPTTKPDVVSESDAKPSAKPNEANAPSNP